MVGSVLVAAGAGQPDEHALVSLLSLSELRVSGAVSANIGALSVQRGHRTLAIVSKGGEKAVIPLARALRGRATWHG